MSTTTEHTKTTARQNATCSACGAHRSRLVTIRRWYLVAFPARKLLGHMVTTADGQLVERTYRARLVGRPETCCGLPLAFETVKGVHSDDHECGARCQNATGPACECSCGGLNHGAAHG